MKYYMVSEHDNNVIIEEHPAEWFGTKEVAEAQGVYTNFAGAKRHAIRDAREQLVQIKEDIAYLRTLKREDLKC